MTTLSKTLRAPIQAGNCIIVCFQKKPWWRWPWFKRDKVLSVTDSLGNAFTKGVSHGNWELWTSSPSLPGMNTVTASVVGDGELLVGEVSLTDSSGGGTI
jgi:hypothetical protein